MTKKKRHIVMADETYKRVAIKAAEEDKKFWIVIDEILRDYFDKETKGNKEG
jgi:hypothetical protein